jgi:uracil-DNA glycosylase
MPRQPIEMRTLVTRLEKKYPNARYELDWETPLQLLIATILAAQCPDKVVNKITRKLFPRYPDANALATAEPEELESIIKASGHFRQKAATLRSMAAYLVEHFDGELPRDLDRMLELPGVARKTANVVLTNAFNIPSGIVVDSHVARLAQRMGLSESEKPEVIERELMEQLGEQYWIWFGPAMILHGRYTCTASKPQCAACIFSELCPGSQLEPAEKASASAARSKKSKNLGEQTEGPIDKKAKRPSAKKSVQATPPKEDDQEPELEENPVETKKRTRKSAMPTKKAATTTTQRSSSGSKGGLPGSWQKVLGDELEQPYYQELMRFVDEERAQHEVFPEEEDVFSALEYSSYEQTKVLLLGQDPYHDVGQAHGLCFSVKPGIKVPPSLVNMYKELKTDLGCRIPNHGYLVPWAEQGILMINAVLTVRAHSANSHKDRGWERFTDAIIKRLDERSAPCVFVLWGAYAQKKAKLIKGSQHRILKAAHPSPLSAKLFMGSKPFSAINDALRELGHRPIDWQLDDI